MSEEFEFIEQNADEVAGIVMTAVRKAVAKQIPKVPYFVGDGYSNGELVYDTWICPNCEKAFEVDVEQYDYCPYCGQRIKWEEKDGSRTDQN